MIKKVNLVQKMTLVDEYWSPKIVGEVNDSHIKVAKFRGEFTWHHHENEDELFLVVKGTLLMKLHEQDIEVNEGEFIIIPKGVEHMPVANEEAHILLIEPKTTLNTGNVTEARTKRNLESI